MMHIKSLGYIDLLLDPCISQCTLGKVASGRSLTKTDHEPRKIANMQLKLPVLQIASTGCYHCRQSVGKQMGCSSFYFNMLIMVPWEMQFEISLFQLNPQLSSHPY